MSITLLGWYVSWVAKRECGRHVSTALKALLKGVQANGKESLSDDDLDEIVRDTLIC